MEQRYFTVKEIANYLRVSEGTIRNWVRLGKIPHLRANRWSIRFDKETIDEWMRESLLEPEL